ncbi:MAG TPA: hypothetical protein VL977_06655 [Solirubrobacteraceae bacterium]|nr:hypothetical protein [Solirubrobacteraceae bacterium]
MRWIVTVGVIAGALLASVAPGAAGSGTPSLRLTQRVTSFAGLRSNTTPTAVTSVAAWAKSTGASAATLRGWGFAGGVSDQLDTPDNPNRYGLSSVVELSSTADANAYLKRIYSTGGPWKHFAVAGIPGAVGFEEAHGGDGGSNVVFTIGPYGYLLGVGWQGGNSNEIANATLIAAAHKLYTRDR